jgi:flagellar assembly protein FliH
MILKGLDIRARSLVVPHSLPRDLSSRRSSDGGAATAEPAPSPEALAAAQAVLDAAQVEAARIIAEATDSRQEAMRLETEARASAERMLAQAQVELGRARAEAERLRAEAEARLVEAGEIIPTVAQARTLLEDNMAAAAQIVAEAEALRDSVLAEAREQGLEEGRAAGREEGARLAREELLHEIELAHSIAANARAERATLIADAEPHIVRLALDVTRKLIAREVEADPDVVKGLVTRALLKAPGDEPARLRLNPRTIEHLGDYLESVTRRFAGRGVEVVPDHTVEVAGAVVETRTGRVDARMTTQVDRVERTLLALAGG